MQPLRVVAITAALSLTGQTTTLQVLRAAPASPADPAAEITITFDRPVAGGLETSIDPALVFSIEPAIEGRLEWRDPMTLRFAPAAALEPEGRYTVTIASGLRAMDGSTLDRAYTYTFRVAAPTVLGGDPVGSGEMGQYLPQRPMLRLLVSAPIVPARLERHAAIVLQRPCGPQTIGVRVTGQHGVRDDDPQHFQWLGYRGPWPRDTAADLRRIVDFEPVAPLPLDCPALLRLPYEVAESPDSTLTWAMRTYGPLRMIGVECPAQSCPTGPIRVRFSTPVRGADIVRHVRVVPDIEYTVHDTSDVSATWYLSAQLRPRSYYAATVDPGLTDIFGQTIEGALTRATRTTGYLPAVSYEYGRLLVERGGLRTLPVQHVNVDSLVVTTIAVPDSMEAAFLAQSWNWDEPWDLLASQATRRTVPVQETQDERRMTGVRLPVSSAADGGATLHAIRIGSPSLDSLSQRRRPIALVQVTDLAVHARIGVDQGVVWVTGVGDGQARSGARVTLHDARGRTRAEATTDARGLATLTGFRSFADDPCAEWCALEGYVSAELDGDRAVVGITSYDPDLAPWRFGVSGAWSQQRMPQAAALFTERGIYRPGEDVIAKTIVRDGPLGSLRAPDGDSVRWVFRDREGGVARDTVTHVGEFGTADQHFRLPADAPLGYFNAEVQRVREGRWLTVAWAGYQVAEYRPPEFLVDVTTDPAPRFGGDTITVTVGGRYLFGAPMAGAPVRWTVMARPLSPWEIDIPGHDEWRVGVQPNWWEDDELIGGQREAGMDTLDATGHVDLRIPLAPPQGGRGATVTTQAMVTDANRQVVTAATSVRVHPASFYIAARVAGDRWFLRAGDPVTVDVVTVTPDGRRVPGVDVRGTIVRREWHRARRVRDGRVDDVSGWVSDTVATCAVTTAEDERPCTFTPERGGSYVIELAAGDERGRVATTRFPRWASGPGWVPWNDDTELKMDIIADRERYAPGDTATLLFAAPFTGTEAWITIERERVIESRRIRIEDGATTLRLPITEAFAPNVFVSMVVVRGRSAEPGPLDDPGRPALRVGYAELRVVPDVKRLDVAVDPLADEYRPGDTARVALRVTDRDGRGRRAEVTLWAVDMGVLALTGYRTPDPLDLLYAARGVGMRLASNLVRVAPQIPDGEKGSREAGGGGGGDEAGILRSRFQTTAFFLGSVVTDANGDALAAAKLPDNLTTFRVMAVAVTEADRFGSGEAELLVTRPLVARPALPRFLRVGDRFAAGVVVNQRLGGTPEVEVRAEAENVRIEGGRRQSERLEGGRAREFRFDILGRRDDPSPLDPVAPDSAWFRFDASAGGAADAVRLGIPYRAAWHVLSGTVAGMLRDTATVDIALQDDVDAARSELLISVGSSPLGFIDGARMRLRLYPYMCTEQISSVALPAIALTRAARTAPSIDTARVAATVRDGVRTLLRRQTTEGGIGYWSASDWSTPWLSGWAGRVLLEARAAGFAVDSAALDALASYVQRELVDGEELRVPVSWWYGDPSSRLSERTAAADFLSRYGRPDIAAENLLLANAARLRWEDRLLLAGMFARRNQMQPATQLVDAAWNGVRVEGRTATLPPDAYRLHYFQSRLRPAARLLEATLLVRPDHEGIGPLVETLVQKGRAADAYWNTQDLGWAVLALADYQRTLEAAPPSEVRVSSGRRTLLAARIEGAGTRDTTLSLDGIVRSDDGARSVRLQLAGGAGAPIYWFATVREAPTGLQTTQIDRGIAVERWYERVDDGRPTVDVAEGDLVRVRLRVTVPAERRFLVIDDPLPAGLEAVDLSLRTLAGTSAFVEGDPYAFQQQQWEAGWYYGSWDAGYWTPFDHRELRDDRVVYSATVLWPGSYTVSYLARATTPGAFVAPPVHAEEMYNPGVNGRSAATRFTVRPAPR